MSVILYILKELWVLIADQYLFSLAILIWIFISASLNSSIQNEAWRGPVFLIGLVAILLFSVATAYHPTPVTTKRERKKL
jgi:hypothetical protein